MGKNPDISAEEAEFIAGCFIRGLSDTEILYEMEDTEFPRRSRRFISRCRKYFGGFKRAITEDVRRNLEKEYSRKVDPIVEERRTAHWEDLANEAMKLKEELVVPPLYLIRFRKLQPGTRILLYPHGATPWIFDELESIPVIKLLVECNSPLLCECILTHLDAEFPEFRKKFVAWKAELGKLIEAWRLISIEIVRRTIKQTGYSEVMVWKLCAHVIPEWASRHLKDENRNPQHRERVKLWQNQPELWDKRDDETRVAYDKTDGEQSPHEALYSILNSYIKDDRVSKVKTATAKLRDQTELLEEMLSFVGNRKTFKETCRICKDIP